MGWGLLDERIPFQTEMGRSTRDDKTDVGEEGIIGEGVSRRLGVSTLVTSIGLQWLRWSSWRYK